MGGGIGGCPRYMEDGRMLNMLFIAILGRVGAGAAVDLGHAPWCRGEEAVQVPARLRRLHAQVAYLARA